MTRAVVICGDAWHPAETVRRGLAPLRNDGFEFEFLENDFGALPEKLKNCSIALLTKANMISATDQSPWLTPDLAAALRNYLQRGNGLIAIHAGTSRYELLPEMTEMIGGAFLRHPEPCAVTVEPVVTHPLAEGVTTFTVSDEHYFMAMNENDGEIFLYSHSKHGRQPAGWSHFVAGNGRVCVLTPGHNVEVWLHPEFQKLLLNAFRWAAKLN